MYHSKAITVTKQLTWPHVSYKKYSHLSNKREVTLTDFEKKIHPPRLLISHSSLLRTFGLPTIHSYHQSLEQMH